jgi:hypothetical protein
VRYLRHRASRLDGQQAYALARDHEREATGPQAPNAWREGQGPGWISDEIQPAHLTAGCLVGRNVHKFVREGTRRAFSGVIEDVAADASLYLRDPERYREIIAFVWDNSRQTHQHSELRQGLLAIPGIVGAVVIPRPGKMK